MAAPHGNQNAAKAKEWEQSLKRAMARKADGDYRKTLDDIATVVVNAALAGEQPAWREVAERMDGKAAQSIDVGSDPDKPLLLQEIVRRIVDPTSN